MRRLLLLTCFLAACRPGPYVPLQYYTRTEAFDLDRTRWLHAHCDLIRLRNEFADIPLFSPDLGNYAEVIGMERVRFADGSSLPSEVALVYSCDQPTPWPRDDDVMASIYRKRQLSAGLPLTCPAVVVGRPLVSFTVVDAGQGVTPTDASYVRYRVTPVVAIPPAREDEARAHGVVAGPRRSFVRATHVSCSSFRDALLALTSGGTAHAALTFPESLITLLGIATIPRTSSLYEWDVELLEVGGVELLYDHVGLTSSGEPARRRR